MRGHASSEDDRALDRLIACALVAEPRASVGRVWRMVPAARLLRSAELRERIRAQQRRAQKVRGWLESLGSGSVRE
jgi:hypothetical protein